MQRVIREILISAARHEDDYVTEPPSRMLSIQIVAGTAFVGIYEWPEGGDRHNVAPISAVQVDARSLLLAVRAALDDDQPGAATDTREDDRLANSHQPWTSELDDQLTSARLASSPPASGGGADRGHRGVDGSQPPGYPFAATAGGV